MTLEYRSAALGAITDRTIELMVAPYDTVANLGKGVRELVTRGTFGEPDPTKVALKLETGQNHQGPVVGRAIAFDDRAEGLFATFRVSETEAGNDALTLAADGAVGASAGMIITEAAPGRDGVIELRSADLREVTLTGTPAYQSATVLEVRSEAPKEREHMTDATAVADDVATPDIDAIVTEAVTRAVDGVRQAAVDAAAVPAIESSEHRGHEYRSYGEIVSDSILHGRQKSPEASERLTALIDAGLVSADGRSVQLVTRDSFGPPVPNSVGNAVPNNVYIPEMLTLLREGRPTANLFTSRNLPADGNTIDLPAISVGNTVGYQSAEGDEVDRTDQVQVMTSWPKATMAGGQPMSLQAQMWSNPSYLQTVTDDLVSAYAEFLDSETINGVGAGGADTRYAGILAGATDVPVTGDFAAAIALTGTAWAAVYAGSRRSPIAAIMHSTVWGWGLNAVDTDGRPLVTTEGPTNAVGIGDAAVAGTYRGLPVVLDDNAPDDLIVLGSFRDALLFEDQAQPAQISLTFPSTLVTDVTVYGFSSLAIRRPAAFAVLSGMTA